MRLPIAAALSLSAGHTWFGQGDTSLESVKKSFETFDVRSPCPPVVPGQLPTHVVYG